MLNIPHLPHVTGELQYLFSTSLRAPHLQEDYQITANNHASSQKQTIHLVLLVDHVVISNALPRRQRVGPLPCHVTQ